MKISTLLEWGALFLVIIIVIFGALNFGSIFSSGSLSGEREAPFRIVPVENAAPLSLSSFNFRFEKATQSISMPVNASVYAGAKAVVMGDKADLIVKNGTYNQWVARNYKALIYDPAEEEFFSSLVGQLRQIRDSQKLDDDEYAELIAVYVQSIPYKRGNRPKFPIETFVEKSGDCDDKSALLAGLLAREQYHVSLLMFGPESHMAVGLACPGEDYKKTGFAYVEATTVSYIGVQPDILGPGFTLFSDPFVIPVGNGEKTYGACSQTRYLHDLLLKSQAPSSGVSRDTGNYILSHQYDRKGTYAYVTGQ